MLNSMGFFISMRPIWGKIKIKSLWKGVRGRTFPQKGFPRVTNIYDYTGIMLRCDCFTFVR